MRTTTSLEKKTASFFRRDARTFFSLEAAAKFGNRVKGRCPLLQQRNILPQAPDITRHTITVA